jgi:putative glutamine amidotransferase
MPAALIGVTAVRQHLALNHSMGQDVSLLNNAIPELLAGLGCAPLLLPPALEGLDLQALMAVIDGLVLSPGQDIAASAYGQLAEVEYLASAAGTGEPFRRPLPLRPDPRRDALEIALYRAAVARGIPVLGVCRGMQLINVAEGGTLWQELPRNSTVQHEIDADGWIHHHLASVVAGSRLSTIVAGERILVSSLHHQGVRVLAPSLAANAIADDGLVEGLELRDARFVIGMQGHVERSLINQPGNVALWRAFAAEAVHQRNHHARQLR